MKSEDEPITNDEWLIRLVWKDRVTNRTPIIRPSSFQPRENELTGISLFRQSCLLHLSDALNVIHETKRDSNALVGISVDLMKELRLSIHPDPIPQVFGHVLVPEINPHAYQTEKKRLEELFLLLAKQASNNILRRPLA